MCIIRLLDLIFLNTFLLEITIFKLIGHLLNFYLLINRANIARVNILLSSLFEFYISPKILSGAEINKTICMNTLRNIFSILRTI